MVHPFQNDDLKSTHPPLVNRLQLPLTTSSVGITLSFCLHTTVYLAIILSWNQSGAFIFLRVQKHYQVYSCISYMYITTQQQMWETRNLRLVHVWTFLYFLYCILLLRQDPQGNWVKINVNFQCMDKINLVPEYFKPYCILFTLFKGYRYNQLSVIMPKTISFGSLGKKNFKFHRNCENTGKIVICKISFCEIWSI